VIGLIGTREARIVAHLEQNGTLNAFEAWSKLGVYRLSASIFNLKKVGFQFKTVTIVVNNCFNEPCRVSEYQLVKAGKLPAKKPIIVKLFSKKPPAAEPPTRIVLEKPALVVPRSQVPSLASRSNAPTPIAHAKPANLSARAELAASKARRVERDDEYGESPYLYPKPAVSRY